MIPQNLLDYVKIYKNSLPKKLCKSAVKNLKKLNWFQHQFYNSFENTMISFDNELSVSNEYIPEKEEINKQVWFAIEKYIVKDFSSFKDWFSGWNGHSLVRFNKYDINTKMKLHCDHIHSLFDGQLKGIPVLTVLGSLNDEYEGGELMMFGDYKIDLSAGSIVVFPSNFMFPHEVKPIKKGIRYSYVSWTW